MNHQPLIDIRTILRMLVGVIWIAGALVNALWTLRHPKLFGDEGLARDASLAGYRWFFGDVVARAPAFWTMLLIIGEIVIGVLTLSKGVPARIGLWGSVAWSVWLFPLIWPYTIMMGPYALLPLWLLRGDHRLGLPDLVRRVARRQGRIHHGHA